MTLLALCSATGSPGVTTTTAAMWFEWPAARAGRQVMMVDADAAGSGILPGYLRAGIPAGGGVMGLAAERGEPDPARILEHAVSFDPDARRMVLTGITDPIQARALSPAWTALVDSTPGLDASGIDALVDAGRLGHRNEPTLLLEHADVVVVVLRSTLVSVTGAAAALRSLRELRGIGRPVRAALVGERQPYTASEIARELDVGRVPVVGLDGWAAQKLATGGAGGWRFGSSALLRGARRAVHDLFTDLDTLASAAHS